MNDQTQQRSPGEIESDIEQHRERLDETLHELEQKFSPEELVNTTLNYVRSGGANDFARNLGESIKQNPVPVMLTGIGLGWLMLSQRNANQSSYRSPRTRPREEASHAAYPPVPAETSTPTTSTRVPPTTQVPPAAHTTGPAGHPETTRHGSGQGKMSAAKEKAQHMGGNVKGRAQHMSDSVKGGAQSMSDNLRDKTSQMKSGSRSAMHSMSYRAQGAGAQTSHFIQEHPLVAGALGVAIGAALGSLLPSTRIEDEQFGDMRDKAVGRAAEEGQKHADKAQAKVHEKAERAKQEAPDSSSASSTSASTSSSAPSTPSTSSTQRPSSTSAPGAMPNSPTDPKTPADRDISKADMDADNPPTRGR
ncbi:Protein of unknown function [Modicisalibacter ilicicola DSM 19980]|uniref:Membrane-anchored ribosome-binding protein, inhibits growth in stationary phase, ElaB/YqjD/DUF883 family n=1 Tax=Modicisalibacter ilicicola DSM 19980 TaxID=1121942 RepID=A0A1M5E5E2_9GAMM|nr:DUF3618 domain-containing protein [Halomonas ilicicola]SHF74405.1 Protein of unknown function [Halomonas ilicicola DSM 19980]